MPNYISSNQTFKYLLVFWMVVTSHLLSAQPIELVEQQTEYAIESELALSEIPFEVFDYELQSTDEVDFDSTQSLQNHKLHVFDTLVMTEPLDRFMADQSKIKTLFTIISYQYFISSLDNFS